MDQCEEDNVRKLIWSLLWKEFDIKVKEKAEDLWDVSVENVTEYVSQWLHIKACIQTQLWNRILQIE